MLSKVLGPGCLNCVMVERVVREVAAGLGVEAKIEKVTDYLDPQVSGRCHAGVGHQ